MPLPPPVPMGPHIFVLSPQCTDGEMLLEKAVGRGSGGSFPLPGLSSEREGRGQSVLCSGGDAVLGNWSWGQLPPNLPSANQETLPCSKPQLLHWLKEEASLVQSLPSLAPRKPLPFLDPEDITSLKTWLFGPPPTSPFFRWKAKILTRLRRGLGHGQLGKRKDDEPDSPPPLLLGGCYSVFPHASFFPDPS